MKTNITRERESGSIGGRENGEQRWVCLVEISNVLVMQGKFLLEMTPFGGLCQQLAACWQTCQHR